MTGGDLIDLDVGLRGLGALLLTEETVATALQRVSAITCRCIAVDGGASVVVRRGGQLGIATFTGEHARPADDCQLEHGAGPCIDALATGELVHSHDLTADARWPSLAAPMAEIGVRTATSAPLVVGTDVVGSLNMYSTHPDAFSDATRESARLLAAQAAVTVANVKAHEQCRERADQLQQALDSRVVIEQAKGVLMEREGCDPDTAFALLRHTSQRANRRLRLVAEDVVLTAGSRHR
ncbi:MAG TPA: GAF and ANTAR domain-containing protein [Acidimicrobiales bacterium]